MTRLQVSAAELGWVAMANDTVRIEIATQTALHRQFFIRVREPSNWFAFILRE